MLDGTHIEPTHTGTYSHKHTYIWTDINTHTRASTRLNRAAITQQSPWTARHRMPDDPEWHIDYTWLSWASRGKDSNPEPNCCSFVYYKLTSFIQIRNTGNIMKRTTRKRCAYWKITKRPMPVWTHIFSHNIVKIDEKTTIESFKTECTKPHKWQHSARV